LEERVATNWACDMGTTSSNEEKTIAAVKNSGFNLHKVSEEMRSSEKVVLAAVQNHGHSLKYASEEMRSNENVVMAAVKQNGFSLVHASEEMKSNENIVMAAVQWNGRSLMHASEEMKSNENVVMTAVQQNGRSLEYASEEMKSNENVVMAAVQENENSLKYASEKMKTKVNAVIMEFECDAKVAALALVQSRIVQLSAKYVSEDGRGEPGIVVTCTNLGGDVVANVILKPDCNSHDLRQRISEMLVVPHPVLRLLLPSGEQLGGHTQKPLRELFMMT